MAEQSYGGDLITRSMLTGDWGGLCDDLSKKGATLDVDLAQTGQGVTAGVATARGNTTARRYTTSTWTSASWASGPAAS